MTAVVLDQYSWLATADDCDDGEEVSSVGLQYLQHLMSSTITLAHTLTVGLAFSF